MNRILKQRARRLYGANKGRLLAAYLFYLVYMLAVGVVPFLLQGRLGALWITLIQVVLMVLITPLMLGITRYTYLLHKERKPAMRDVFYYFTGLRRYGKAVALGIIQNWPSYLGLFSSTASGFSSNPGTSVLISILNIICSVAILYWSLHICLLPYIMVEDEKAGPGHIRRESFRLMRGNCGRYFALNISFIGWYLLIVGVIIAVMIALILPEAIHYARLGLPTPETLVESYTIWIELALYGMLYFLVPYVGLANAAFGDMALQGRLDELAWQARMPYGAPYGQGQYPSQGQWRQYGQQYGPGPYPPRYPQGAPGATWQYPGQGQAPAWGGAPGFGGSFTPAQREEAEQYARYRQGIPMAPKTFLTYGSVADLERFLPWPQVEQSDLYSFLKLENWMPGMVTAAWRQAAGEMASRTEPGASVSRFLEETLGGTRFRVTVSITDDPQGGYRQVCIRIDLSPSA